MSKSRIIAFLKRDVPYTKDRMEAWKKEARALGDEAPAIFIETLKTGSAIMQYPALIALREFGYEAWGHGYWKNVTYSVAKPGMPTLHIVPARTDLEFQSEPRPAPKSRKASRKPVRAAKPLRRARTPHRV